MNNQRNNRRRGRGNRNQGGNPNAMNRIDSRARGNAPQLLDKYKKLAQDAHHNGDRVQQEYYLQFADHYFRVIADNKARQDEQRAKRDAERGKNSDDDDDDGEDNRRPRRNTRQKRDDRDDNARDDNARDGNGHDDDARNDNARGSDDSRSKSGRGRKPRKDDADDGGAEAADAKPARRTRKAKADTQEGQRAVEGEIDAAVLPPSFSDDGEARPKAKRAPRRTKAKDDDENSGPLSAVG